MAFTGRKNAKPRLHLLNQQRRSRIHKLIERGLIKSADEVPEFAIPIDVERSRKIERLVPEPFYEDIEYRCVDCRKHEVWRAETQQYFFEVLGKSPYKRAVRCWKCQAVRKRRIALDREQSLGKGDASTIK